MKAPLALILFVILIACGVPQAEYDQVVQKVDSLQAELDSANVELAEFKSAPDILLNDAKNFVAEGKIEAAIITLEALLIQFPSSSYATEANQLIVDLKASLNEEKGSEQ